jgi:tetratricopeptide (TPR) repeat protein
VGYLHLGTADLALGDYDAALKAYSDAERFSGGNSGAVAARASVLARMGHTDNARDIAAQLQAKAVHQYVPPYEIAGIYASLGEIDKSFEWLERALSVHDAHLLGLEKDLALEPLGSDPRYISFLTRRAALIE